MDSYLDSDLHGSLWSGLLSREDDLWVGLAHHQQIVVPSLTLFEADELVMLYDWKVSCTSGLVQLFQESDSRAVRIPRSDYSDPYKLMEVCSGLGGISTGLAPLGFVAMTAMDINSYMCDTLRQNGHRTVLQGDLQSSMDRHRLHLAPEVYRGTLCAGFPCQPLSRQGDQLGDKDPRSQVFTSTLKVMWEQQHCAMVLECVPGARQASWVQDQLQCLAWSMGMHFEQRILSLDRTWPCRRTRWWLYMVPKKYVLQSMLDLPIDTQLQHLEHLFPQWTTWASYEMEELYVPEEVLNKMSDERYGTDIRRLQQNRPCPCILHSYSFGLSACPCGCRTHPFSEERLLVSGLRGFYVLDECSLRPRYLHVKEAAFLCTLDPLMDFGSSCRDKLCLIGQVAAPLQALWVGTFLLDAFGLQSFSRDEQVNLYKWHLLRRAHYAWPSQDTQDIVIWDEAQTSWLTMRSTNRPLLSSILTAEHYLHHESVIRKFRDFWDVLPKKAFPALITMVGPTILQTKVKKQGLRRHSALLTHQIPVWQDDDLDFQAISLPSGSFVFELFSKLGIFVQLAGIQDIHGNSWRADDRLWEPVLFASYCERQGNLMAFGCPSEKTSNLEGISDRALDYAARRLIAQTQRPRVLWLSSAFITSLLYQADWTSWDGHPFLGALHGSIFTGISVANHWVLVEFRVIQAALHVHTWTGEDIQADEAVCKLAGRVSCSLGLRGFCLTRHFWLSQHFPSSCGAIAILHLGCRLGLWKVHNHPDEFALYTFLCSISEQPYRLIAYGRSPMSAAEQDVVWQLRDLLKSKGVDDSHTEERALAAVQKIGLSKLQEALKAKHPWQALKGLGNAPKVNFLWVKPDELERQIRARASSKFQIGKSNRKQQTTKPRAQQVPLDPELLDLMPDTFMTQDGNPILPIPMTMVGKDRAGLAFGTVAEVIPFLKEGASLTLDALAVLTVAPVPVESHGLLPVTNIRYPALYKPTQEPILIDGSLIQLGDISVVRHRAGDPLALDAIPTGTVKLSIFRDEWPDSWEEFTAHPMKLVTQRFQKLVLCRGLRCGGTCEKFHPPVDTDIDSVILDLWSRSWQSIRGKKCSPKESDQFQVLLRVPKFCVNQLQGLSGSNGLYIEPRRDDGRGPAEDSMMIWLQSGTLEDALHKSRTVERVLAIGRFGLKYGIRVLHKDAESTHAKLNPEEPFHDFQVQLIHELRPLPHGTQKAGVIQLLKKWQWKARPLQPHHSDTQGMGWLVGSADPPPAQLLHASHGDVTVVLHKKVSAQPVGPKVLTTLKTRSHMKQMTQPEVTSTATGSSSTGAPPGLPDPWANWKDPWSSTRPVMADPGDVTMLSRADQLEERVVTQLQQHLKENPPAADSASEARFQRLEVDITELRQQQSKFENWFQDAAAASSNMQNQIGELRTQVNAHTTELGTVRSEIQNGFQHLEALFSKKHRTE